MFTKFRMKEEKGFTLIELLIVVAIIGILAAIAIPQFGAYRKRGYNAAANSDLRGMRTTEEAMQADFQDYGATTSTIGAAGAQATVTATLAGGLTTTPNQSVSLSSNVKAIAYTVSNAAGTARSDFVLVTGHSAGDTYYGTSNGTVTGSSNLYRKSSTTISADTLTSALPTGITAGAAGAAAAFTESSTQWVKM